jgi:hypothetical protein
VGDGGAAVGAGAGARADEGPTALVRIVGIGCGAIDTGRNAPAANGEARGAPGAGADAPRAGAATVAGRIGERAAGGAHLGAVAAAGPPTVIGRARCTTLLAGGTVVGAAVGSRTIENCAVCAAAGEGAAPNTGAYELCGIAAAVAITGGSAGELGHAAPGQNEPVGHGAPGIGAPCSTAPCGAQLGAELCIGAPIIVIHRSSFCLTAPSRRWTTSSITFSMGMPALSAVAIVATCVCSGVTVDDGGAPGTTGAVSGGAVAAGDATDTALPLRLSSAARSVRHAMAPATRWSGAAPSMRATRIEASRESMETSR